MKQSIQKSTSPVAVITGASSGIGAATAIELDRMGMNLVLVGRDQKRLAQTADKCHEAAVVVGDLTDPTMADILLDTALAEFGRCDVLVNNAGVMEVGTIETIDMERTIAMVRINVEAALRIGYVFLKHFKKMNHGDLVNISSILGTKSRAGAGPYAGTKYAIEAWTEALRMELAGTDVRVCAIEPGLVETHLQDHFEVHPAKLMSVKKMLAPADIARGIGFVLAQPRHVRVPRLMMLPGEQAI